MVRIIQRGIIPILLFIGGIASVTYGVRYHTEEVFREKEIEISLAPPEMPPPGFEDQGGSEGQEGSDDPGGFGAPEGFGGPGGGDGFNDPGGFDDPMGFGGPPADMFAPPPEMQKIKQIVLVSAEEPETALVRDVTFGGLKLLESGELQRTYTGKPPSLCPT